MSNPSYTLAQLADHLGAQVKGDPACPISGVASIRHAKSDQICVLSASKYRPFLATTQAAAVLLEAEDLTDHVVNALIVANPRLGLVKLLGLFYPTMEKAPGIHPTAIVDDSANIDKTAHIGAHCVIGAKTTVGPGTVIEAASTIANDVSVISILSLLYKTPLLLNTKSSFF